MVLAGLSALLTTGCVREEFAIDSDQQLEKTSPVVSFSSQEVSGRYIVVLEDSVLNSGFGSWFAGTVPYSDQLQNMSTVAGQLLLANGVAPSAVLHTYSAAVRGFAASLTPVQALTLSAHPMVKFVEPDQQVSISGGNPEEGGNTAEQVTPWGITRVRGGVNYGGENIAWVIDSGVDLDHPDLRVDSDRGFNSFKSGVESTTLDDLNGHGTHVAGIIGAKNNDEGVIGVAAGAVIVPVKVLDKGGNGYYSQVIAGVDWVRANGRNGDVANMSLTGGPSQALDIAVLNAADNGIRFCLAAGNFEDNAANYSPARANGNNVFTVSATTVHDFWAGFSNFGNPPIDYCEPGENIYSTYRHGTYTTLSGTSMAAPHLAGLLLLGKVIKREMVSGDPDGNPDWIGER